MSFLDKKNGQPLPWKPSLLYEGNFGSIISLEAVKRLGYRSQDLDGDKQRFKYRSSDGKEGEEQTLGHIDLSYYVLDDPLGQIFDASFHVVEKPLPGGYDLLTTTDQDLGEWNLIEIFAFPIEPAYKMTPGEFDAQRHPA